ncbi:MAG: isoprenyl transferase [Thermoanaerobaculia bacterium]
MTKPVQLAEPGSADEILARRLDMAALPRHVAIIMDGNGRWARSRGLPRVEGHRAGVAAVRDTIEAAAELDLDVLTLYAFSVENWKRPRYEVWTLMNLLKEYLRKELSDLVKNSIRLKVLGRWRELDPSVVKLIERAERETQDCDGLQLNIALNYSGRTEIVDACRQIVADWAQGKGTDIDEETLDRYLYTAGLPDPDLLIRTSGEMRVSNFLLWQISYTEICVIDTLWPDFRRGHLFEALLDFQTRNRRFGAVESDADEKLRDASG